MIIDFISETPDKPETLDKLIDCTFERTLRLAGPGALKDCPDHHRAPCPVVERLSSNEVVRKRHKLAIGRDWRADCHAEGFRAYQRFSEEK